MRGFRFTLGTVLIVALASLSGCGWFRSKEAREPKVGDLLADLPAVELPEAQPVSVTREDVMVAYERVYGAIPDALQNHAVGKRLADLEMAVGEERDMEGIGAPYDRAVDLYKELLATNDGENRDEILYQLARAHDVIGETDETVAYLDQLVLEHPDSRFVPEARFRRAEIAFSREAYRGAATDYRFVVSLGDKTPYLQNARYMLGWSEFKIGNLDAGLASFFDVIDANLEGTDLDTVAGTERELVDDSFRVVTLALGYLDGAQTLAEQMEARGKPSWQYLAYERLASDYAEKERYLDSVATWTLFVERNTLDARAPAAHLGIIQTLIDANYPSEIRPRKEAFVANYGVRSQFWQVHDESVRESYLEPLGEFLDELAKLKHAEAQESGERSDYLAAADLYEQFVATFPQNPVVAEYLFLLGEVYTEAGESTRAVAAYQTVVRDFPGFARAAEAGYAAILELDKLVSGAEAEELELWQRLKIDAQIEFALVFPNDERAPAVQTAAADALFAIGDFEQAVDIAQNALDSWPTMEAELVQTAYLILGHGWFELGGFATAEQAYVRLLSGTVAGDDRDRVQERLLAAVYKQGEAADGAGNADEAVGHFLRLAQIDPTAELTAKGHYDAVAIIETAGRPEEAAALLAEFRQRFPNHELAADIDKRLASLYEATNDYQRAAEEYLRLARNDPDEEVRRQSLYRAAELQLELNSFELAIDYFREYAHGYPEPAALNLEAMHQLDELYQATGQPDKRRFWLAKKIDLHRRVGTAATERMTYLAAQAQFVLADDERVLFEGLRLGHPLKQSLKKKQRQLTKTVKAFEKAADYQVVEFATAATFNIANLYASLSSSLMNSARPSGLSELELAQYEILLEEQAFPFEEQAIALHEINMRRSWNGTYDEWVQRSFDELGRLMPARFDKRELEIAYVDSIH